MASTRSHVVSTLSTHWPGGLGGSPKLFKAGIAVHSSGIVSMIFVAKLPFEDFVFKRSVVMSFAKMFDAFVEKSPVSVMFRGTLEHVFSDDRLDEIFDDYADMQYCRELTFSTCVELMGLVVTRKERSVNTAYRTLESRIPVAVQSVYGKLARVELPVSEGMVRDTAKALKNIVYDMKADLPGPIPGYDVRIVDGNHIKGTQHRLKELRDIGDSALPGHTVAIINPHVELIEDLIACDDGHVNQRTLYGQLLSKVQPRQCWIADRDYCTKNFLFGIKRRKSYFVIRQHGNFQPKKVDRRKRIGRIEAGVVYEQEVRSASDDGCEMKMRRITIKLDSPTREGDTEIHILTNLPKTVRTKSIALAYRSRWSIETAFQKLTIVLKCEVNTLGYPQAALFGFCIAVMTYNAFITCIAALRIAHEKELEKHTGGETPKTSRKLSFYYFAIEITRMYAGMMIAIPAEHWTQEFAGKTSKQMARLLLGLARKADIHKFLTNPVYPQKRTKKRTITTRAGHVSTNKILQAARNT